MQLKRSKKVLIGFERTGTVRRAFRAMGFDAWSCDLVAADDGSNNHITGDIRDVMYYDDWELMAVFHPPCTRLCNSGVRWLTKPPRGRTVEDIQAELVEAADLFSEMLNASHIPLRAIENPVMHCHARALVRGYEDPQYVQPWWFGDPVFKRTGLHLRGLPRLVPTNKLTPPKPKTEEHKKWSIIHRAPPSANRGELRSAFFPGLADAMAVQWGRVLNNTTFEAAA